MTSSQKPLTKEMHISVKYTINLGNYSTISIEGGKTLIPPPPYDSISCPDPLMVDEIEQLKLNLIRALKAELEEVPSGHITKKIAGKIVEDANECF